MALSKKNTTQILHEQNMLLSRHAELVPGLIFQYQVFPDGRFFFPYASSKIWDIFEVTVEEAKQSGAPVFARVLDEDKEGAIKSIRQSMKTLNDWDYEFRVNLPSKGIRWLSGHAKPEKLDDGSYLWHGYYYDITERKLILEQINQSLQEKEVLLKEVHHRVKNNLQVISSILNLQSSYVKDEATINVLRESQNRIKSMAFIHESLYQADNFSSINFADYVVNLLQNLMQSYSKLNQTVKLNVQLETIFLNLDLAIPCGLIINEIISNALKYAFVENKEGDEITIKIKKIDERVQLFIGDNGVGLPENIDYKNTESLGLQLVVTLVGQLFGNIELDSVNGTKYTISFLM
jgi:two-component sensor histidine kinase